jgi:hypothetical protein
LELEDDQKLDHIKGILNCLVDGKIGRKEIASRNLMAKKNRISCKVQEIFDGIPWFPKFRKNKTFKDFKSQHNIDISDGSPKYQMIEIENAKFSISTLGKRKTGSTTKSSNLNKIDHGDRSVCRAV